MGYFPGNIMVIDDKYDLVNHNEPTDPSDRMQYKSLIDIKKFADKNGIPLVSITNTDDAEDLTKTINLYDNVRLLVLDLDLNNDGNVSPEDDYLTVKLIVRTALEKYGYFILMINSAHSDQWSNIVEEIKKEVNPNLLEKFTYMFDKMSDESAYHSISKIGDNYSMEIIYHFETKLNEARDKAFNNYFDFEKNSWELIFQSLKHETGLMAHSEVSNILLSTIKQYLIDSRYPDPPKRETPYIENSEIKKLVFETINYIRNKNKQLEEQPIWTGNFYKTNIEGENRKYALIITPECDIAQNKQLYYKVVYGFEINDITFPNNYKPGDFVEQNRPVFPQRIGEITDNNNSVFASKKSLDGYISKMKSFPNQYLYLFPFITNSLIYIDFRDVRSHEKVDLVNWTLLLRINEPMITDILDKYSNLHNRKGLVAL